MSKIRVNYNKDGIYNYVARLVRKKYIIFMRQIMAEGSNASLNDLKILHEDSEYVIVNKRYDVKVNTNHPDLDPVTVSSQLMHLRPDICDLTIEFFIRFVHRLDYATSGVLCLGKNKKATGLASQAFAHRRTTKHYLALVRGHVDLSSKNEIDIDIPIGQDKSIDDRMIMTTSDDPNCHNSKHSLTKMVLLERGTYSGSPASKLLLIPKTGRTHQLRVHCVHMNYPIVGDYAYSGRKDVKPYRMMLHAYRLILPLKKQTIDVRASDQFLPEVDDNWKPEEVVQTYDDFLIRNDIPSSCAEENKTKPSRSRNSPETESR